MGILHISNVDDKAIMRYNSATTDEQEETRQILSFWIHGNSEAIERLISKRRQADQEKEWHDAMAYADNHPAFPLNWSKNRLSREEMNER